LLASHQDGKRLNNKLKQRLKVTLFDQAYESFAIQNLSAILKKEGFDTSVYFDCSLSGDDIMQDLFLTPVFSLTAREVVKGILSTKPAVVGFSLMTIYYQQYSNLIRLIKSISPETVIVCGGPHCLLASEKVLSNPDIDFIIYGDGDISFPRLLGLLEEMPVATVKELPEEQLPGVYNTSGGRIIERGFSPIVESLDSLPFLDKEPYYRKNPALKSMYTTICSRGCLFKCTYCNSASLREEYKKYGLKYFRYRSVDNVMGELVEVKEKYRPRHIEFLDSLFAPNLSWITDFMPKYKAEVDIPFYCEINPNSHSTENLDLLREAGCVLIQFGFQSAVEEVRKNILHRSESNERIRELISHSKKLGMLSLVDHIANLPGEKREHLDTAVTFYGEVRPHWINLAFLQYYPKAKIVDIGLSMNSISESDIELIYEGTFQASIRMLSKSNLNSFYRTLPLRFFFAIKMKPAAAKFCIKILDVPVMTAIFSRLGSLFIYVSRMVYAFSDRRDFLIRHHIKRTWSAIKAVIKEKYLKHAG
jgi:anaerobic magnesium-protoporphyrin IX monomethyl ester cyclase